MRQDSIINSMGPIVWKVVVYFICGFSLPPPPFSTNWIFLWCDSGLQTPANPSHAAEFFSILRNVCHVIVSSHDCQLLHIAYFLLNILHSKTSGYLNNSLHCAFSLFFKNKKICVFFCGYIVCYETCWESKNKVIWLWYEAGTNTPGCQSLQYKNGN